MRRGQVWVETVIYTLIGLALIGLVLGIITPKINERQNRIIVEQSIDSVKVFDELINEVLQSGGGNVRSIPSFRLKEGEIYINGEGNSIELVLKNLKSAYSQPGAPIQFGSVKVLTEENAKTYTTTLKVDYDEIIDITYEGENETGKFNKASVPYKFIIENSGNGVVDISSA